jgi:hypothetical protein
VHMYQHRVQSNDGGGDATSRGKGI